MAVLDESPGKEMASVCRSGYLPRVEQLLAYGVDPSGGESGRSYVSIACEHGHAPIVDCLLRAGGPVAAPDLAWAIRSGSVPTARRVVDDLRRRRVEYDFWAADRPLLTEPAFLKTTNVDMVRFMLAAGADPTERDRFGKGCVEAAERAPASPEVLAVLRAARPA